MTSDPSPEHSTRHRAYVAALAVQAAFFAVTVGVLWGNWLQGDSVLYELPAWNLAQGHGLTYGRHQWEDPTLTGFFHSAHPEQTSSPWVPAVTLPPGYSVLLGALFALVGRSHLAAVLINGLLLLVTLAMMRSLAERSFGQVLERRIALVLVAVLPDWAFWAGHVMSDTLHVFLLTLFCVVFFREGALSNARTFAAGVILGLACLVRPYALLLPLALGLGWFALRRPAFRLRSFLLLTLTTWAVVGSWTARNYYYFERFIPVTSMQLGDSMWMGTYEVGVSEAEADAAYRAQKALYEDGNMHHVAGNAELRSVALSRIRDAPIDYALACALRIPRLWTVLAWGPATLPVSHLQERGYVLQAQLVKLVFASGYVVLFLTMLAGILRLRQSSDPVLVGGLVLIVYYTLFFVPLHTEARYTLPARFFGILFSAAALAHSRRWLAGRNKGPGPGRPASSPRPGT